jgi:hypothetical protein
VYKISKYREFKISDSYNTQSCSENAAVEKTNLKDEKQNPILTIEKEVNYDDIIISI